MGVPIAGVELWIIEKDKEPVAKEPVYWNDVNLWDTTTRYSLCERDLFGQIVLFPLENLHLIK